MRAMDEISVSQSQAQKREKRKLALNIAAYLCPIIIIVVVFVFAPLAIILFFSFFSSLPVYDLLDLGSSGIRIVYGYQFSLYEF
mgnify:CR=1 FL=1